MINKSEKLKQKFLILWFGQLLSKTGSGISAFAAGIYILRETENTTAFSMLLLVSFLPSVLLSPAGGVISDRKDRRMLMAASDIGSAAAVLSLIYVFHNYSENYSLVLTAIAVISVFSALHSPAYKASVTDLIDKNDYTKAAGLMQLAEASRYIISPVIAAGLISRLSLEEIFFIDFITFTAAAAASLSVAKIQDGNRQENHFIKKSAVFEDIKEAVSYIIKKRDVLSLAITVSFITFLTGILQVLFPPIVISVSDAETLGAVQSISASGMIIGSICISLIRWKRNHARSLKISMMLAGMFFFMTGFFTDIYYITASAFCLFLTLPFINTDIDVLLRTNIDNNIQGRIWSLVSFTTQAGMLLSFSCTGFLADRVFNPLFSEEGFFADWIGNYVGSGNTAGSSIIVMIAGFLLCLTSLIICKKHLQNSRDSCRCLI